MRRFLLVLLAALVAVLPSSAFAQDEDDNAGFMLRIGGDVVVGAQERVETVIVLSGDARIEGVVEDTLVLIDGTGVVTGEIDGDVLVVSGDLALRGGSRVDGDIRLIDSDLTRARNAVVTGDIDEGVPWRWWWSWVAFPVLFWAGMTVALAVAALVFAGVGGRQLKGIATLLTDRVGWSILAAVLTVILLPLLAVLAFVTVIGIPLAVGLVVFLLPSLLFLGYLVFGARMGMLVLPGRFSERERPYLAAATGVVLLQVVALVPVLGGLVVFLGALWGTGALALYVWRSLRGRGEAAAAT